MNDHSSVIVSAPTRPYLGLDYFREEDAALFKEREKEIRDCASMLLSLNVKIFVLQGSTGAGKSSFLRAGLVPRLRQKSNGSAFFVADGDCVIRCTADPLLWIHKSLDEALRSGRFAMDALPGDWPTAESAAGMPRNTLADTILAALHSLCRRLPGHLVLILDQAEEVLTQAQDRSGLDEPAQAFFYFLEEVYLRNIDVRIVVALRTEYYGRFRDELRIEDDRLTSRPHSGGVEPFLLRPIRDPQALVRIIEAPTRLDDGRLFNFTFASDAAHRIVKDLLDFFAHGSVTPFLQVICAILYERLSAQKREITLHDYEALDDLKGIAYLYLDRGVKQALGPHANRESKIAWLTLLYGLTSTQGGGMVVSNIESLETLRVRAEGLGIPGDIEPLLGQLCGGCSPLLRGLPVDRPTHYSLKHDVLAVVFSRWNDEYTTTAAERKARKQRAGRLVAGGAVAVLFLASASGWWFSERAEYKALERSMADRLAYAVNPPRSDYVQSLAVMVNGINALDAGPTLFATRPLRDKAIEELRSVILRSPTFSSEAWSASFDSSKRTILLLASDGKHVSRVSFADGRPGNGPAPAQLFILPDGAEYDLAEGLAAAGEINEGFGPTVVLGNELYHWDSSAGKPVKLTRPVGAEDGSSQYTRHEIMNGMLHTMQYKSIGGKMEIHGSIKTGNDLRSAEPGKPSTSLTENQKYMPPPMYSDSKGSPGAFAFHLNTDPARRPASYRWMIGSSTSHIAIPLQPASSGVLPAAEHMRIGFVNGDTGVLVQQEPGKFEYVGLAPQLAAGNPVVHERKHDAVRGRPLTFFENSGPESLPPIRPYMPWAHSPIAAVRYGDQLKVAWITAGGIATASGPFDGTLAGPPSANRNLLLTGEPNGSKLQFSDDGKLLVLQQQPFPQRPMKVRVWELSEERKRMVRALSEKELVKAACAIILHEQRALLEAGQADSETKRACPAPAR